MTLVKRYGALLPCLYESFSFRNNVYLSHHMSWTKPFWAVLLMPLFPIWFQDISVKSGLYKAIPLTHRGRVTHICIGNLTIIGSDNGLSPGRRQAIIWTNDGIVLIGPLGTNFSEISIEIHILSFMKMHLKMSSGKWRPFCLGLNV